MVGVYGGNLLNAAKGLNGLGALRVLGVDEPLTQFR
jgi:hypothetical protein